MDVNLLTYNTHGLPWSRVTTKDICDWISEKQPHIICLQEVFTKKARNYYIKMLEHVGYSIVVPEDGDVTALPSGLLSGFLRRMYCLESSVFCPYTSYQNVEVYANKGFHLLRLKNRAGKRLVIINTHMQSDTEARVFFGKKAVDSVRFQQFVQLLEFVHGLKTPVLLSGDLNCERSPHSELRFLTPLHQNLFHKATFYSTGEDLDHVAWILEQYAPKGCMMCDVERFGPILKGCTVFQLPYSDHAPVLFDIYVPLIR